MQPRVAPKARGSAGREVGKDKTVAKARFFKPCTAAATGFQREMCAEKDIEGRD